MNRIECLHSKLFNGLSSSVWLMAQNPALTSEIMISVMRNVKETIIASYLKVILRNIRGPTTEPCRTPLTSEDSWSEQPSKERKMTASILQWTRPSAQNAETLLLPVYAEYYCKNHSVTEIILVMYGSNIHLGLEKIMVFTLWLISPYGAEILLSFPGPVDRAFLVHVSSSTWKWPP